MATDPKGVIYLEVDEDITSAIDKLTSSDADTVQVVSAKRSTLFQSVINLKLIQKAAKDAKKNLVLVTGDRVATSLAARLAIPVASQVGEAPRVGAAAAAPVLAAADDEIDGGSVGEDSAKPAAAAATPLSTPEPDKPAQAAQAATAGAAVAAAAKPKKQRVPNVSRMQKRLLWAGLGVFVLLLLFGVNYYVTKADVTLYARADQQPAEFTFTADPTAQTDIASGVVSAQQLSSHKSLTASVQATGTKDEGTKAQGTMKVYNKYDSNSHTFVAGTRFVSGDGHVFRTTSDVTVPGGSLCSGGICPGQASVNVTADQNGDSYNLASGTKYTIPALPADQQAGIYGTGDQMSGGTTKTAKIIQQSDIDKAKQAALDADKAASQKDLESKANNQQTALDVTLTQTVASADSNPDVGAEAQTATLTIQVDYTELAVQKSALSELAKSEEGKQLGDKQIYDDGSGSLQLSVVSKQSNGAQKLDAHATAYVGSKIDTAALAANIKGKKYGEAADIASRVPGVDKADITISPSWATSMPHIKSHIKITIKASNPSGQ